MSGTIGTQSQKFQHLENMNMFMYLIQEDGAKMILKFRNKVDTNLQEEYHDGPLDYSAFDLLYSQVLDRQETVIDFGVFDLHANGSGSLTFG